MSPRLAGVEAHHVENGAPLSVAAMPCQDRALFVGQRRLGLGPVLVVSLLVQEGDGLADRRCGAEPLSLLVPAPLDRRGESPYPSKEVLNGGARRDLLQELFPCRLLGVGAMSILDHF